MQQKYDSLDAGHAEFLKTSKWIPHLFYWQRMKRDIKDYLAACDVCQRNKKDTVAAPGLLEPSRIPSFIWTDVNGFISLKACPHQMVSL